VADVVVPFAVVAVSPPGLDVTVYDVTGDPLIVEAVQATDAEAFPAVAVTPVGAAGGPTVTGVAISAMPTVAHATDWDCVQLVETAPAGTFVWYATGLK
jgi:hypothetical protein